MFLRILLEFEVSLSVRKYYRVENDRKNEVSEPPRNGILTKIAIRVLLVRFV